MKKIIILLWPGQPMSPATLGETLLQQCAPRLLALQPAGLQINVVDEHVTVPSPAPTPAFTEAFSAQVNLWLQDDDDHAAYADLLREADFQLAAYAVDEWLYTDYGEHPSAGSARDWTDGQRSPGVLAVTLLRKPRGLKREAWLQRWFGWQSPMSEWMQPRARYVRHIVEKPLTPGAEAIDGIVEEDWPSEQHVRDPKLFYGASNWLGVARNMAIMLHSVTRILNLFNITTVMMSEYFIKTPQALRQ